MPPKDMAEKRGRDQLLEAAVKGFEIPNNGNCGVSTVDVSKKQ